MKKLISFLLIICMMVPNAMTNTASAQVDNQTVIDLGIKLGTSKMNSSGNPLYDLGSFDPNNLEYVQIDFQNNSKYVASVNIVNENDKELSSVIKTNVGSLADGYSELDNSKRAPKNARVLMNLSFPDAPIGHYRLVIGNNSLGEAVTLLMLKTKLETADVNELADYLANNADILGIGVTEENKAATAEYLNGRSFYSISKLQYAVQCFLNGEEEDPKYSKVSPFLEPSLQNLIAFVEKTYQYLEEEYWDKDTCRWIGRPHVYNYRTGEFTLEGGNFIPDSATVIGKMANGSSVNAKAGQLSAEKKAALDEVVEKAKGYLEAGRDEEYRSAVKQIIAAGKEYIASGQISDKIINNFDESKTNNWYTTEGPLLEYSSYRATLEGDIWKAYATMMIEPEIYPLSSKRALYNEIDRSERTLDGSYTLPKEHWMLFVKSRPDEAIQFATKTAQSYVASNNTPQHKKASSAGGLGIEPMLVWYEGENILYSSYLSNDSESGIDQAAFLTVCEYLYGVEKSFIEHAVSYEDKADALAGSSPKELVDAATEAFYTLESDIALMKSGVQLTNTELYEIAKHYVALQDGVRIFRDEIVMGTEVDSGKDLFFDAEDKKAIKEKVNDDPDLNETYNTVKSTIDDVPINILKEVHDDIMTDDLDLIAAKYKRWVQRRNQSFKVPAGAKYAKMTITLPSRCNTVTGLGYTWFDTFALTSNGGSTIEIPNADFEKGNNGKPSFWNDTSTGNGVAKWQTGDLKRANSGSGSLYLENPDEGSQAQWTSDAFDVVEDTYTMSFCVSNLAKHNEDIGSAEINNINPVDGAYVTIYCYDENDNLVYTSGNFAYNAAGTPTDANGKVNGYNSLYQAAGIAYLVDGDESYAVKAKYALDLQMSQHIQGNHHWMVYNKRPLGDNDAYGEVQEGRNANSFGTIYEIVKNVKLSDGTALYTKEEKQKLVSKVDYYIRNLVSIKEITATDGAAVMNGFTNWQMDMNCGTVMLASAFGYDKDYQGHSLGEFYPENKEGNTFTTEEYETILKNHPGERAEDIVLTRKDCEDIGVILRYARTYLDNASYSLKAIFTDNIKADGGYPASLRYHGAFMEKVLVIAKAMRNMYGINWFTDPEVNLSHIFKFYTKIMTPRFADGGISTPVYGDHGLSNGGEYYFLGGYWDEIDDEQLRAQVYRTWELGGKAKMGYSGEANAMQILFGLGECDVPDYKESITLDSSVYASAFGVIQFRNNFMVDNKESYLSLAARTYGDMEHKHADNFGMIMYADNVPLIIDVGVGNYWAASKADMTSSAAHGTVQLMTSETNASNTPDTVTQEEWYGPCEEEITWFEGKRNTDAEYTGKADYFRGSYTGNNGKVTRNVAMLKDGFEAYVVWDQIDGSNYGSRFNLPTLSARDPEVKGNVITVHGFENIDLEAHVLEGDLSTLEQETMSAVGSFPIPEGYEVSVAQVLRWQQTGDKNLMTVLFPKTDERGSISVSEIAQSTDNTSGYAIRHSGGNTVVVLANDTDEDVVMATGTTAELKDMMSTADQSYTGTVTVPAGHMMLLSSNQSSEALATPGSSGGSSTGAGAAPVQQQPGGNSTTPSTGGLEQMEKPAEDAGQAAGAVEVKLRKASKTLYISTKKGGLNRWKAILPSKLTQYKKAGYTVTFRSSDKKVAVVSSKGNIRAKKTGKATITVKFKLGNKTVTKKCKITVRANK